MFSLIPTPYRILIIASCLVLAGLGGYWKGRSDANAAAIERERDALVEYTNRVKQAGEQHDKDQITIDRLAADARRVRIHIPTCPTAENPDGGSGVFSDRVDQEFEIFSGRVGEIIQRCDRLNADAIRSNKIVGGLAD